MVTKQVSNQMYLLYSMQFQHVVCYITVSQQHQASYPAQFVLVKAALFDLIICLCWLNSETCILHHAWLYYGSCWLFTWTDAHRGDSSCLSVCISELNWPSPCGWAAWTLTHLCRWRPVCCDGAVSNSIAIELLCFAQTPFLTNSITLVQLLKCCAYPSVSL